MLPLGYVISKYNISFHWHTDDTQIYLPLNPQESTLVTSIQNCIKEVKLWTANWLQLNDSMSEVVIFGPSNSSKALVSLLGPLIFSLRTHARS